MCLALLESSDESSSWSSSCSTVRAALRSLCAHNTNELFAARVIPTSPSSATAAPSGGGCSSGAARRQSSTAQSAPGCAVRARVSAAPKAKAVCRTPQRALRIPTGQGMCTRWGSETPTSSVPESSLLAHDPVSAAPVACRLYGACKLCVVCQLCGACRLYVVCQLCGACQLRVHASCVLHAGCVL